MRTKYGLVKPFVLFVGSFHPRKNLVGLLDAFEAVAGKLPHDLVIIGSKRWRSDAIIDRVRSSSLAERIRFIGLVPRAELPRLFNAAELFVFPSLYEGFGFPVLEALACGCPTITTNVSSLPEVAGDAAVLVSPGNIHALGEAVFQVLTNDKLRTTLRRRGPEQAQRFSWTAAAAKTIELLERAALPSS